MKLINPLLIARILRMVVILEGIMFLLCVPVAMVYGDPLRPFLIAVLISAVFSEFLAFISRKADSDKYTNRDGYLLVTFSWLIFSLLGTIPYLVSGSITNFTDAFFESASGFTTTGSTILTDIESVSHSLLFYRSFTQWIGGIGIIALIVIVLPSLRFSGYQLLNLESSVQEKFHPRTSAVGIRIFIMYAALTIAEILLLSAGEMNFFDAVCHSFGTVASGGFSTKNSNLISFSAYTQWVVMLFMFLAGTSQVVLYYFLKRNIAKIRQNEEVWMYMFVILIAAGLVLIILLADTALTPVEALRHALFNVISIVSCTGYYSADYDLWPAAGTMLIFLIMFAGGSTGSTAGGIRMARHLVVLKNIRNAFIKITHPKSISIIRLNGKMVSEASNISILSFVVLYLFVFITGTMIVVMTGVDPITSASSTAACMAGIGPGTGLVGPLSNYSHLPGAAKIFLSILMIVGRLELITFFAIFTRTFWKL